jgi:hypothetical protein
MPQWVEFTCYDKRHIMLLTQRKEKALRKKLRVPTFLHTLQAKYDDSRRNCNLGVSILFSGPAIYTFFYRINAHFNYCYICPIYQRFAAFSKWSSSMSFYAFAVQMSSPSFWDQAPRHWTNGASNRLMRRHVLEEVHQSTCLSTLPWQIQCLFSRYASLAFNLHCWAHITRGLKWKEFKISHRGSFF